MRHLAKQVLTTTPIGRVLGPVLRGPYERRVWRGSMNLFSGVYPTYEEAISAIPPGHSVGWNEKGIAKNLVGDRIPARTPSGAGKLPVLLHQPSTFAVLLWIKKLIGEGARIVDVGGASGITYWHYRDYFGFPPEARWTVVDMPEIIARGRILAASERDENIQFREDLAGIDECDIVVSLGCVQYMSPSAFAEFLKLVSRARYAIINKMPLIDGEEFWTLQSLQTTYTPYWIANRAKFLREFRSKGFEACDAWAVPELKLEIPFAPQRYMGSMSGVVFRRERDG